MPIRLEDFTDNELRKKGIDPALREHFIEVAYGDDLKPTPEEKAKLDRLLDWHRSSQNSSYVLGKPIDYDCRSDY